MTALAFLDTETVTLDVMPDVIWEVGVITRDDGRPDDEWMFQIKPNMIRADDDALKISGWHDRNKLTRGVQALGWAPPNLTLALPPARLTFDGAAEAIRRLLTGRHVVGAVPNFDTERLSLFMRKHLRGSFRDPWHYHLIDVENLAVGYLAAKRARLAGLGLAADFDPEPPWNSDELTAALGLDPIPDDQRHTALGDARWARAIYDAVMTPGNHTQETPAPKEPPA